LPPRQRLKREWILGIFEKLRLRYDNLWTAKVGGNDERETQRVMDEWAIVLADLSPEQIRSGLELLDAEAPQFPPGVMEFKQLCKKGSRQMKNKQLHRSFKALPQPKANKGTGLHWCAALRAGIQRAGDSNAKPGGGSPG
jgi:hypothetical protein